MQVSEALFAQQLSDSPSHSWNKISLGKIELIANYLEFPIKIMTGRDNKGKWRKILSFNILEALLTPGGLFLQTARPDTKRRLLLHKTNNHLWLTSQEALLQYDVSCRMQIELLLSKAAFFNLCSNTAGIFAKAEA